MSNYMNRVGEALDKARAVFFDWDDTLILTARGKIAQNIDIAAVFGRTVDEEEVRDLYATGGSFPEMMQSLCGTSDMKAIMAEVHKGYDAPQYAKQPIETMPRDIKLLKRIGYQVGVLSSTTREVFEKDMTTLEIDSKLFDYVQLADDTEVHKPHPAVFDPAVRWLLSHGIKPSETVYVGDGLGDMNAADGAGIEFIAVGTGLISAEEFAEHGVMVLPGVHELANIVRRRHGQL